MLLVALFALLALAAAACGSDGSSSGDGTAAPEETEPAVTAPPFTPAVACAGGTGEAYAEQRLRVSWAPYCPTFLPEGVVLEVADFTFLGGQGVSQLKFRLPDGLDFDIIQGVTSLKPRDGSDLPIIDPTAAALFGDLPAGLFMTKGGDVPLVVTPEDAPVSRAVVGSAGVDPDVVVAVAAGMAAIE